MNLIRSKILISIIIFYYCLLSNGCLENPPTLNENIQTEETAEILTLIENRTDFFITSKPSFIITAWDLALNSNDFNVLDIRSEEDFNKGHINGATNIIKHELLYYITQNNLHNNNIVIISEAGQSAAYYTALLRLYGIQNAYALKYGMASWHIDFSDIWLNELKESYLVSGFTNYNFPKYDYSSLPKIELTGLTLDERLKNRINYLFTENFIDDSKTHGSDNISINLESVLRENISENTSDDLFFLCYGSKSLYLAPGKGEDLPGHPKGAILYLPFKDLKTVNDLQTIPNNKKIIVYSDNGHKSAAVVAYLRLLGYDAYSVLFGGNSLFYSRFLDEKSPLYEEVFKLSNISNFEYVK